MKKQGRLFCLIVSCLLIQVASIAQDSVFHVDSVGRSGIYIDHVWQFKNGDDASYANFSLDDSRWDTIHPELNIPDELKRFSGTCWFRLHVRFDSSLKNLPLAITIFHTGASEIFLDGEKIGGFGNVSSDKKKEITMDPLGMPIPFNYNSSREHVFAIRYSNHDCENGYNSLKNKMAGFYLNIVPAGKTFSTFLYAQNMTLLTCFSLGCFYLVLGLVHLLLWAFYKRNKSNLYYFFFTFTLCFFAVEIGLGNLIGNFEMQSVMKVIGVFNATLIFIALLNLVYHLFYQKFPARFKWYFIVGIIISSLLAFRIINTYVPIISFWFSATIDTIFTVSIAVRKGKRGSKIIAAGILLFTGFVFGVLFFAILGGTPSITIGFNSGMEAIFTLLFFLAMISIPVSMSIFLAKEFSETNRSLMQKLEEVEILSAKTIEQEKEKQKILEGQKENLETEVNERTAEIVEQKKVLEEKQKEILDSIRYAKRIQESLLPTLKYIDKNLNRLRGK